MTACRAGGALTKYVDIGANLGHKSFRIDLEAVQQRADVASMIAECAGRPVAQVEDETRRTAIEFFDLPPAA